MLAEKSGILFISPIMDGMNKLCKKYGGDVRCHAAEKALNHGRKDFLGTGMDFCGKDCICYLVLNWSRTGRQPAT
ncbi:hypothetical protein [Nitratireductor sp. L15S-10]|uniref:hypothetical protein n=1 Tax=Nitratireductor sp. L15S-10 TaxID=3034028 RepID=UPI0038572587